MTAVDTASLEGRLGPLVSRWSPGAHIADLRPLLGGLSSLTYLIMLTGAPNGHERIVVKLAPPGLPPTRNRDVLRQARVLRALAGSPGVAVPPVVFDDPGAPPEVPPLFAMDFVEGESFEPLLDEADEIPPADEIRRRAVAAVDMLVALHSVDSRDVGLTDEPGVPLGDEVDRWVRIFETVDDDLRPRYADGAARLHDLLPEPLPSVISHGEYRLGNMLCRDGRVTAIIDWELWSRQDPRIDLSWFLQYCAGGSQPTAIRPTVPGLPTQAELFARYEQARGRVPALEWFLAHAQFKQAAINALISKYNRRRPEPDPGQEERSRLILPMIEEALALLA